MNDNATIDSPRTDQTPEPFKGPHTFLPRLAYVAAISAIIILASTGFGVWGVVSHYLIRFAENSSVNISAALSSTERDSFFTATPKGQRRVAREIPPDQLEQLDGRVRQFLKSFDIVKIKVYTREGLIMYSTDRAIIGERDLENRRLANALTGRNDSKLVRKGRVQDLANESKLDVDVVETYVPIYDDDGEVIGCFEVYIDVSSYRGEIWQIVSLAVSVIAVVTLVVYGIAFIFLRKITQKLKEAANILERYAASDPLTGLHNRRHIFARARQELARLQRERVQHNPHTGMSVTLIDLDYFKMVNDAHGHLVGDEVLKETITEPGKYICNPALTSEGRFPGDAPVFSILYSGMGHETAGKQMLVGFVAFLLAPTIAAWMLSLTSARILSSYPRKVLFFAAIGLLFAVFGNLANSGLGSYPPKDALILAGYDFVLWTLVGLVVAWRIRPERGAVTTA